MVRTREEAEAHCSRARRARLQRGCKLGPADWVGRILNTAQPPDTHQTVTHTRTYSTRAALHCPSTHTTGTTPHCSPTHTHTHVPPELPCRHPSLVCTHSRTSSKVKPYLSHERVPHCTARYPHCTPSLHTHRDHQRSVPATSNSGTVPALLPPARALASINSPK